MRWLRRALFLLLALLALPVLAVVGVLAWANTESGLSRLAALASSQVPGLTIEGLRNPEVRKVRETLSREIAAVDGVTNVAVEEREQAQVLAVQTRADAELTQPILGALDGANVGKVVSRQPTLEDAYVELVAQP